MKIRVIVHCIPPRDHKVKTVVSAIDSYSTVFSLGEIVHRSKWTISLFWFKLELQPHPPYDARIAEFFLLCDLSVH
jgi:hypothetical protein